MVAISLSLLKGRLQQNFVPCNAQFQVLQIENQIQFKFYVCTASGYVIKNLQKINLFDHQTKKRCHCRSPKMTQNPESIEMPQVLNMISEIRQHLQHAEILGDHRLVFALCPLTIICRCHQLRSHLKAVEKIRQSPGPHLCKNCFITLIHTSTHLQPIQPKHNFVAGGLK